MENIMKIFNSEDKQELKNAFKEIIKEHFRTELEDLGRYLFDPNEIESMINDSFGDVVKEVRAEFKASMKEQLAGFMDKKVNGILKGIK